MSTFSFSSAINNLVGNTPGANVSNLVTLLNEIKTFVNGNLDPVNLSTSLKQYLGLTDGAQVGRGKFVQATAGTRTNTAYGALSNGPDVVAGLVVPTDALIFVLYEGTWKCSVDNVAMAGLFVGATQVLSHGGFNAEWTLNMGGPVDTYANLGTYGNGLASGNNAEDSNTTEPRVIGGYNGGNDIEPSVCIVKAPAGTHDVSVQFKSSSGTITAKNRRLYAWSKSF